MEPWFWRVGIAEGTTEAKRDEWEREHESIREDSVSLTHLFLVDRVRWFRKRARWQQHEEEIEILKEEFRRTERAFQKMANAWTECSDSDRSDALPGANAYAAKIARMYLNMALCCGSLFQQALQSEPLGWKATHE